MKSGKFFLFFVTAFFFAIFGLFSWYALTDNWVNTNMPYDLQALTRWEFVIALWFGLGVVLIGAYQGAKDSGWKLPTYETFDGGRLPILVPETPASRLPQQSAENSDGFDLEEWPRR